jgi:hypothetical protein
VEEVGKKKTKDGFTIFNLLCELCSWPESLRKMYDRLIYVIFVVLFSRSMYAAFQ